MVQRSLYTNRQVQYTCDPAPMDSDTLHTIQATYRYTPISTARSTRIVEILPALTNSDTVIIKIHETQIDPPKIPYEALSYTWDGQVPDRPIECDQKRLYVTENAFDILCNLRRPRRSRFIWIDGICIDQTCEKDKSRQIAMMADIYRKAKQVVVWLGELAPTLTSLHQAMRMQARRNSSSFLHTLRDRLLSMATNSLLRSNTIRKSPVPIEHLISAALDVILHHRYWQRAWTAQEFALNQKCSLQFSNGEISKEEFKELLHMSKDTVRPFRLVHLATWLTDTRGSSEGPVSSIDSGFNEICSIFECLPRLRSYLPVDRVFALVSVYPSLLGKVTIDYRCKPAKVYTEAALCIIKSTGHLSILSFAGSDWGGEVGELPSWVPDWSMTRAPLPVCGKWFRQLSRRRSRPGSTLSPFDGRGVKLHGTRRPVQCGESELRDDETGCHKPVYDLSRALSEGILQVKGVFLAEVRYAVSDPMRHSEGIAFLSTCRRRFGLRFLKEQLITCEWCFNKHFTSYQEVGQHHSSLRTSLERTAKGSIRDMMECMELYDRMFNRMYRKTTMESSLVTSFGGGIYEKVKDTTEAVSFISSGQRLFMTGGGTLGISERVEQGDRVVLIAGCDKPFIIRQDSDVQSFERYRLVGEAYLNGVQDGQKWPPNDKETTDIFLV